MHWHLSSLAGLLLTGQWRPVCAWAAMQPDCAAKRAFCRAMERAFAEPGHVERVARVWAVGAALREDARLNALADARAAGPFLPVALADL